MSQSAEVVPGGPAQSSQTAPDTHQYVASERAVAAVPVAGDESVAMPGEGFKEGDVCGGWKIEKFIAAGGMGEVYEVRGTFGGKRGALKQIRPQLSTRVDLGERFETEIRILAELDHPYIVGLLHAGKHDGRPYMVMEWLDGMTLRDFMNQRAAPISLEDALYYAICICEALCAAHEVGILHRDLKPENIFMLKKGTLKVLDFGLGKLTEGDRVSTSERLGGLCTVHYAPPEQLERKPVDDRSDVYALGLIILEMATGQHGFADRPGVLPAKDVVRVHQFFAQPNSLRQLLPNCPEALAALVDTALAKDKADRPHSKEMLAGLVAAHQALTGVAAPRLSPAAAPKVPEPPLPSLDEGSVVRLIPNLRTETLPPDLPPGDPTAAGNPAPPPVRTMKMVRPREQIDAAFRAKSLACASPPSDAHDRAGETTGAGRSATLPPELGTWHSGVAAVPAPVAPSPALPAPVVLPPPGDAVSRESLEFAARPTQPWRPAAPAPSGAASLTPLQKVLPAVGSKPRRPKLPMWVAPVLGGVLTLAGFAVIKVVRSGRLHPHREVDVTTAPTGTTATRTDAALADAAAAVAVPSATGSSALAPLSQPSAATTAAPSGTAAATAAGSATAAPVTTTTARQADASRSKSLARPAAPAASSRAAADPAFVRPKPAQPDAAPHRLFGAE